MEILSIVLRVPKFSKAYVHGSVLTSSFPNDFDLIVIYDENICSPLEAFTTHEALCNELRTTFKLYVHLTLLTQSEARHVQIIERTNAIPLEDALKNCQGNCKFPIINLGHNYK